MGNYQELIYCQKARQAAREVDALVKSWPKTMQTQEISRQLFRSATSVGANIAEALLRDLPTRPNIGFIPLKIVDWVQQKKLMRY